MDLASAYVLHPLNCLVQNFEAYGRGVKYWDSNSIGDEGGCQGRIGVNSDGFLQRWTKGVSTPDLIVTEFGMGCRQMDLASACVLCPLNRMVLDFKMGGLTE